MSSWFPLDWIVAYFGLAGLALWMLDRSHRSAFAKLSQLYEKTLEHQEILIEVIKLDIDALKSKKDA